MVEEILEVLLRIVEIVAGFALIMAGGYFAVRTVGFLKGIKHAWTSFITCMAVLGFTGSFAMLFLGMLLWFHDAPWGKLTVANAVIFGIFLLLTILWYDDKDDGGEVNQ